MNTAVLVPTSYLPHVEGLQLQWLIPAGEQALKKRCVNFEEEILEGLRYTCHSQGPPKEADETLPLNGKSFHN